MRQSIIQTWQMGTDFVLDRYQTDEYQTPSCNDPSAENQKPCAV